MKVLLKAREFILEQKEELALIETLESGKPISQARDEIDWTADLWQYAASLCRNIRGDTHNTLGDSMLGLPTIFDGVSPDMAIAREEIFGPVLSVLAFDTAEEAIEIANDTNYGLSASVWTRDFDTALSASRRVRAGTVWVNTFLEGYPELPFGGFKECGKGREVGRFAIEEFTELKTI